MKHDPIPSSPESPRAADDSPSSGPRWTPRKMAEFLRVLAATRSVKAAAASVGMSRQSAYKLRARLKGQAFDAAWEEAFHPQYSNIPYAALERALHGVEVPYFYKGKQVGTLRRYDERLTLALLKLCVAPGAFASRNGPAAGEARLEALIARVEAEEESNAEGSGAALSPPDSANPSPSRRWP